MKWMYLGAIGLATLTLVDAGPAQANRISEVVAARANARAGGPVSEHDAWILERYGALSGTPGYWNGRKAKPKRRTKSYWYRRPGYRH